MARVPTPCAESGCAEVTVGARCSRHRIDRAADYARQNRERPSPTAQGYGWRWRKLRRMVLARQPVCAVVGCMRLTVDIDHIVPKARGGRDAMDNLQGLCRSHHSQKTARENAGHRRG